MERRWNARAFNVQPVALTRSSALAADTHAMPRFVDTDRRET
jgi:hypothetical protein